MTAGRTNSSAVSQHWGTPAKYVNAVREFFGGRISLDPCSNELSIVGADTEYALPAADGLASSWDHPTIFVNPPYGKDRSRGTTIRDWLRKSSETHSEHRSEVLALVPVATNTRHWKQHIFGSAAAVAFLADTRLRFLIDGEDRGKGAPMACAMVYWGRDFDRFDEIFTPFGNVADIRGLLGKPTGPCGSAAQAESADRPERPADAG